ncbi:conserved hypothetical protein [uncultured delta proteobacterium]|uniref:UPF0033 domain-containing protein n=1 Tax=uncultured delta proteobacterium TaxID=34034 RepID=A0A212JBK0_9DELT|nr:conserved hypothetical protein [uncultured delta proteobacterium]
MYDAIVDCRGLPCPQPVIRLKRLLEESSPVFILVTVDNEPALENVCRFLAFHGYATEHAAEPGAWRVKALRGADGPARPAAVPEPRPARAFDGEGARTLVMLIAPVFGSGDDTLGTKLMRNFLATLPELGDDLWRMVLLNGGVRLAAKGSPVLEELKALESSGVSILVCGACLEFFGLTAEKAVGETTNMLDIVTSMQLADKVIRI